MPERCAINGRCRHKPAEGDGVVTPPFSARNDDASARATTPSPSAGTIDPRDVPWKTTTVFVRRRATALSSRAEDDGVVGASYRFLP